MNPPARSPGPPLDNLDLDAEDDTGHGRGAPSGDPRGRTGADTAIGGTGPGGPQARAGGDHEGSETRGAVEGSRLGSALGVEGGSADRNGIGPGCAPRPAFTTAFTTLTSSRPCGLRAEPDL